MIGRECGSGGRALGKELARRLNVRYYDKELLSSAAKELGLRADIFERTDEKKPSLLRSMLGAIYGNPCDYCPDDRLSAEGVYEMQSRVIRKIITTGPCVIVGRTADYIGRDLKNLLSLFLHAPLAARVAAVKARDPRCAGCSDGEIADRLNKIDAQRRNYYSYFTGREWGEASNYHLSINTELLSIEQIAELVEQFLAKRAQRISAQ